MKKIGKTNFSLLLEKVDDSNIEDLKNNFEKQGYERAEADIQRIKTNADFKGNEISMQLYKLHDSATKQLKIYKQKYESTQSAKWYLEARLLQVYCFKVKEELANYDLHKRKYIPRKTDKITIEIQGIIIYYILKAEGLENHDIQEPKIYKVADDLKYKGISVYSPTKKYLKFNYGHITKKINKPPHERYIEEKKAKKAIKNISIASKELERMKFYEASALAKNDADFINKNS